MRRLMDANDLIRRQPSADAARYTTIKAYKIIWKHLTVVRQYLFHVVICTWLYT